MRLSAKSAKNVKFNGCWAALGALTVAFVLTSGAAGPLSPRAGPPRLNAGPASYRHFAAPAAPRGWAPVAFEGAQISVPARWPVYQGNEPNVGCGGDLAGEVAVFAQKSQSPLPGPGCPRRPENIATISPAVGSRVPHGRSAVVNGLHAVVGWTKAGPVVTEVEQALSMRVSATGPLAKHVLGTITRSPLSVVLGSKVIGTPPSWRAVSFGGLRFSVPRILRTSRDSWWGGCPYRISPDDLRLSTASALASVLCRPPASHSAGYLAAVPGMVVGAGSQVEYPVTFPAPKCMHRNGLRICIFSPPRSYIFPTAGVGLGLLSASVFLPGRTRPDEVEIGLSGSGATAQRIFDSLRPARELSHS